MTARCYVCGSSENVTAEHPHSPTCETCKPAHQHVVSMRTGPGGTSLAVCPCGWRSEVPRTPGHYAIQDVRVRLHWRTMIRHAAEMVLIAISAAAWLAPWLLFGALAGGR